MKAFITTLTLLSSLSAFADCSIFVNRQTEVTADQEKVISKYLEKKGYTVAASQEEANRTLDIYTGPRNKYRSMWYTAGQLNTEKGSQIFDGGDYALMLPLHMATMSMSTLFFKSEGTLSMANMMNDLPACDI